MKLVYDFNFSKAAKKAETLINECVREKKEEHLQKYMQTSMVGYLKSINLYLYMYIRFFIRMALHSTKTRYTK